MNQFALQQGSSRELDMFPHIVEFSLSRSNTIQLDSFAITTCDSMRIYYIVDGKFEWTINRSHQILYPGDIAIVLPGQEFGGARGFFDIGTLFKLHLRLEDPQAISMQLGKWSSLTETERITIGKILQINNMPVLRVEDAGDLLSELKSELVNQEIGYLTKVNHILDLLLILIARQSTRQASSRRDFPGSFANLEDTLRKNLAYQWTVEEMAALVGLGTTAFTEKVKAYTGFSPLNYLINIRISEAIKLLKKADVNVTDIALETGFYSSQHFSTTFKKLTGYTPGEFRKRNIPGKK
jgi:AraC-like DNA-binding protein